MNVFRSKEAIAVHVLIGPKIHLIVILCAGIKGVTGLVLVILACISVAQAWAAVETTLVSVHAKGPAFKAARWLQLVAELLVLLISFAIQSLLLAALEQYTEDVTAWILMFTFAWELAKSGFESLKDFG